MKVETRGRKRLPEAENGPVLHVRLSKKVGAELERQRRVTRLSKRQFVIDCFERLFFGAVTAGGGA